MWYKTSFEVIFKYAKYLSKYKKETILAIIVIIGGIITSSFSPLLYKWIVDKGITEKNINTVYVLVALLVAVLLFQEFFYLCQKILMAKIREKVFSSMRFDLYSHLQKMSMSFFSQNQSGKLLSRVVSDVDAAQNLLTENLLNLAKNVLLILIIGTVLFYINFKITIMGLLLTPVLFYTYSLFVKKVYNASEQVRKEQENLIGNLQEDLSGVKVIQSYDTDKKKMKKAYEKIRSTESIKNYLYIRSAIASSSAVGITVVGVLILWGYGSKLVIQGEMTVGSLIAVSYYFNSLMGLFNGVFNQCLNMQTSIPAAKRIFEILETVPQISDSEGAYDITDIKGDITFEKVNFGYEPNKNILTNINLKLKAGSIVAVVGSSGEGKTSLINLIPRFYDPTSGRILLDGKDLREIKLNSLRRHIAIVPQDSFLFNDSILENIVLGRSYYTYDEVVRAAKLARAHDFIIKLPKGYETTVGELGSRLSGGQRKRIAITRALLSNPKVIIFDEATADLDEENERLIMECIKNLSKDKTVLLVTHKLSNLSFADRILTVKGGHVYETIDRQYEITELI